MKCIGHFVSANEVEAYPKIQKVPKMHAHSMPIDSIILCFDWLLTDSMVVKDFPQIGVLHTDLIQNSCGKMEMIVFGTLFMNSKHKYLSTSMTYALRQPLIHYIVMRIANGNWTFGQCKIDASENLQQN